MPVVIAVEGIHGVGKSTFLQHLRELGRTVIDEEFMNTTMQEFNPTGMARQTVWLADWITRIVNTTENMQRRNIIYVDRSMYSALMYNTDKDETRTMRFLIDRSLHELNEIGIHIHNIVFTDDTHKAWERIQKRLETEPERKQFNEHDKNHYNTVWDKYYSTHANIWSASMTAPAEMESLDYATHVFDNIVHKISK